jgi:hypothetical protein
MLNSGRAPSREAELMLCCATSLATPARTARLHTLINEGIDWQLVAHLAQVQAVIPLVYRYLTAELEGAPRAVATNSLRPAFYGNSVRSLHLARELIRLTALLERGGVEPLALKGPALAVAAYGAIAQRQFSDLDLLVRASEVPHTVEMLEKEGYAPRAGYRVADFGLRGAYEIALARPGSLLEVDLHWRLIPAIFRSRWTAKTCGGGRCRSKLKAPRCGRWRPRTICFIYARTGPSMAGRRSAGSAISPN